MPTYAEKLRAFADYLDEHPGIAEKMEGRYEYPTAYIYAENWDDFQELIGHLGGYEKSGHGGQLTARHYGHSSDSEYTLFHVSVSVSGVCEAKPKLDEEGKPVMKRKAKYVESDEFEEVLEWECPDVWSS